MSDDTKMRVYAGSAGVISGVMLIGTTGVTFLAGWALWAAGLAAILGAGSAGRGRPRRRRAPETAA